MRVICHIREVPELEVLSGTTAGLCRLAQEAFLYADEHIDDDGEVERLKVEADHAKRALRRATNRLLEAEAREREAKDALKAAQLSDAYAQAARIANDELAPVFATAIQIIERKLVPAVGRHYAGLRSFAPEPLLVNMETLTRIDTPPPRAKAPVGLVTVLFVRSYPGNSTFPPVPPYAEGDTALFEPDVAARLIEAGYAEIIKDAA